MNNLSLFINLHQCCLQNLPMLSHVMVSVVVQDAKSKLTECASTSIVS